MTKKLKIKICGINDPLSMSAACSIGVDFVGLVFYQHSPRNISFEIAKSIIQYRTDKTKIVALTVDCDDNFLDLIFNFVKPDYVQLHGNEKPSRCVEIKKKYKTKIIKALEVKNIDILLSEINNYKNIADLLLLDSPKSIMPGGNGKPFDWNMLNENDFDEDWLLAGGLNEKNIHKAVNLTNPTGVDISSGVEIAKGKKSPQLIKNFVRICRNI